MKQVRKEQRTSKRKEEEVNNPEPRKSNLTDDLDSILEDIDAVLEENAEEFVKGYIQKGGQ